MSDSKGYLDKYLPKAKKYIGISASLIFLFFVTSVIIFLWGEKISIQLASDTTKYSEFGEFSGGILASVFSFLTFVLLLLTYYTQKADSESNKELTNKSLGLIRKQNFEDTFFQMVKNLNDLLENTTGSVRTHPQAPEPIKPKGNEYFEKLLEEFKNFYFYTTGDNDTPNQKIGLIKALKEKGDEEKEELIIQEYNEFYHIFYSKHNDQLGHIFRYIHNILKFSEEATKDTQINSKRYVNILQSQLSDSVLALLFYNSISDKSLNSTGEFEFRERLDKYGVFQNLRESNVVDTLYLNLFENTEFRLLN